MRGSQSYRRHHYVPQWYQRGFIPSDARFQELALLDLKPAAFRVPSGKKIEDKELKVLGPKRCFAIEDLYTTKIGNSESRELEKRFFGDIDTRGSRAARFLSSFDLSSYYEGFVEDFLTYVSSQKLRTPTGLDGLVNDLHEQSRQDALHYLEELRSIFGAIWAECVWEIAEIKEDCDLGFIISDHPVTIYNKSYAPGHPVCRGFHDPDIRCHGSHTIFPLSLSKVLILTNRTWACDPSLGSTDLRPNPKFDRGATFNIGDVHTGRQLELEEVLAINWVIKKRARRFIAAGKEEWLYPEQIQTFNWREIGERCILMPDPRSLTPNSETTIAFDDGSFSFNDAFGHRAGHPDFGLENTGLEVYERHRHWREQFEALVGPEPRGEPWIKP